MAPERSQRDRPQRSGPRSQDMDEREKQDLEAVLRGDYEKIDTRAEIIGGLIRELTSSQVRNFYGPIVKARSESDLKRKRDALLMHRPRLAYLVARADGKADELWKWFRELLRRANDAGQIRSVCDFAEAIVAYHKRASKPGRD